MLSSFAGTDHLPGVFVQAVRAKLSSKRKACSTWTTVRSNRSAIVSVDSPARNCSATTSIGTARAVPIRFDKETRAKAVRLVKDHVADYEPEWAAIRTIASGNWVSDAEIAETRYTAFTSRRKSDQVTVRLIVRGVKDKNVVADQGELFTAWRYHAFVTDSAVELAQAEKHHREHAIIEQANADLKDHTEPCITCSASDAVRSDAVTMPSTWSWSSTTTASLPRARITCAAVARVAHTGTTGAGRRQACSAISCAVDSGGSRPCATSRRSMSTSASRPTQRPCSTTGRCRTPTESITRQASISAVPGAYRHHWAGHQGTDHRIRGVLVFRSGSPDCRHVVRCRNRRCSPAVP